MLPRGGASAGRGGGLAGLALCLALVLAGCGTGPDDAPGDAGPGDAAATPPTLVPSPAPVPAPAPSPPAGEPTALEAPVEDPWTPWAKGGPPATDLSDLGAPGFTTPDGNIACRFGPDDAATPEASRVRCDRLQGLGVDQPAPLDCAAEEDLAWGDAVATTAAGGTELLCVGDSVHSALTRAGDDVRELSPGSSVRYAGLTCSSRDEAVQCLGAARRGFVISAGAIVTR